MVKSLDFRKSLISINIIFQANRNNIMDIRRFANDLSLIESKIKSLRLIINLPLTQNRNLSITEKEKVKNILNEIQTIINTHLSNLI